MVLSKIIFYLLQDGCGFMVAFRQVLVGHKFQVAVRRRCTPHTEAHARRPLEGPDHPLVALLEAVAGLTCNLGLYLGGVGLFGRPDTGLLELLPCCHVGVPLFSVTALRVMTTHHPVDASDSDASCDLQYHKQAKR